MVGYSRISALDFFKFTGAKFRYYMKLSGSDSCVDSSAGEPQTLSVTGRSLTLRRFCPGLLALFLLTLSSLNCFVVLLVPAGSVENVGILDLWAENAIGSLTGLDRRKKSSRRRCRARKPLLCTRYFSTIINNLFLPLNHCQQWFLRSVRNT